MKKWEVSYDYSKNEKERQEWTSLDQIQGIHTRLRYNVFGISFVIQGIGGNLYNIRKANYFGLPNIIEHIMTESNISIKTIQEALSKETWTAESVKGLMDYGLIEGISAKLALEDKENGTHTSEEFRNSEYVKEMKKILDIIGTDEKCMELMELGRNDIPSAFEKADEIIKVIAEEKERSKSSGAEQILEFMREHKLTENDLALALAMAQVTTTGVREAQEHIVGQKQTDKQNEGPTQLE